MNHALAKWGAGDFDHLLDAEYESSNQSVQDSIMSVTTNYIRVRIHQPFSRTFFVFFSKICKFECDTASDWLNRMVYGLANRNLCYIQILLNIKKSGKQDYERSEEWLWNTEAVGKMVTVHAE